MFCVVCYKESGEIIRAIENAIRNDNLIEGDNGKIVVKPEKYSIFWTNQKPTPIYDSDKKKGKSKKKLLGYKEKESDLIHVEPLQENNRTVQLSRQEKIDLLSILQDIAQYDFDQADRHIDDKITNLAEAKQHLKRLTKAQIATIKLLREII